MDPNDATQILRSNRPLLDRLHIQSVYIFGSVARGQATDTSDVDLLVDFDQPVGLLHLSRVSRALTDLLGTRVDVVTRGGLRPEYRETVLREARHAA